jgi:hypothetical protein
MHLQLIMAFAFGIRRAGMEWMVEDVVDSPALLAGDDSRPIVIFRYCGERVREIGHYAAVLREVLRST